MTEARLNDFKDTELGPLPAEWKVVRLGEVATLVMGQSPPSSTYTTNGKGLPFLQGKAEFGDAYPRPVKWCSKPLRLAKTGSVLISVRAPVGDVNLAQQDYCIGRGLASLSGRQQLDNLFLFYLLFNSKSRLEEEGTGTTFKSINKSILLNFPIPLPPLPEQQAIARVLRTVQQAIEATERVVAAARELKRSLMDYLFTYGPVPADQADQMPLKETELGPIPAHWQVVRLGEVAETPQYGFTAAAQRNAVGPRMLRITDIQDGHVDWNTVPYCECAKEIARKYVLQPGDILFARTGSVGKSFLVASVPNETIFASYLIRVQVDRTRLEPEFAYLFMQSEAYWEQITSQTHGAVQPNVNATQLRSLLLPLPPLPEQREMARILRAVDEKIRAEESRKQALEALFKTLLHHLMTARVRLPADFVEAKDSSPQQFEEVTP